MSQLQKFAGNGDDETSQDKKDLSELSEAARKAREALDRLSASSEDEKLQADIETLRQAFKRQAPPSPKPKARQTRDRANGSSFGFCSC